MRRFRWAILAALVVVVADLALRLGGDASQPEAPRPTGVHRPAACPGPTVAVADYFPLEDGRVREFARVDKPSKRKTIATRAEGERWAFQIPRKDGGLTFVFGLDAGELRLHGFEVQTDRIRTGLVELPEPALVGDAASCLDGPPLVSEGTLTAGLEARLMGDFWQPLEVTADGTVTAAWSRAPSVEAHGERYDDVVGLSLSLVLELRTPLLDGRTIDADFDGVLAHRQGYVQFTSKDHVYRLLPPEAAPAER